MNECTLLLLLVHMEVFLSYDHLSLSYIVTLFAAALSGISKYNSEICLYIQQWAMKNNISEEGINKYDNI